MDREKQLAEEAHRQAARDRGQAEAERAQASKYRESMMSILQKIEDQYAQVSQDRESGASLLKDARADRAKADQCFSTAVSVLEQVRNHMARLEEDRAEIAYDTDAARDLQAEDRAATAYVLQKAKDVLHVSEERVQKRIQDLKGSRDALRDDLDRKTAECQTWQERYANLPHDLDDEELAIRRAGESVDKAEELNCTVRDLESGLQSAWDRAEKVQNQALFDAYKRLRIEDKNNVKVAADIEHLKREVAKLKSQSDNDSVMLREKLSSAERELQDMREQCKRLRTDRVNRELESRQGDNARPEDVRAEGSPWKATLHCVFQYLAGLNPDRSGSYGPDFKGVDDERLMRPLTYFLARKERRDRFTTFLGASSKPDGWYCLKMICGKDNGDLRPVDGKCPIYFRNDCQLQVRHLDASSGGKTLDFRVPIPDESDDDEEDDDAGMHQTVGSK